MRIILAWQINFVGLFSPKMLKCVNTKNMSSKTLQNETACQVYMKCLSATSFKTFNIRTQRALEAKFFFCEKFLPLTNVAAVNNDDDGC